MILQKEENLLIILKEGYKERGKELNFFIDIKNLFDSVKEIN